MVAGDVEDVWVMGRDDDGIGPLETVLKRFCAPALVDLGPHGDVPQLASAVVVADQ